MTENDPNAQGNTGDSESNEGVTQQNQPHGQGKSGEASTPPGGIPAPGVQRLVSDPAPNPWSAQAHPAEHGQYGLGYSQPSGEPQNAFFGAEAQQHQPQQPPYGQPAPHGGFAHAPQGTAEFGQVRPDQQQTPYGSHVHNGPVQSQQRTSGGPGKIIVGVAVLALIVGGAAGGVGGYLASESANGDSASALEAPKPAKQTSATPDGTVESVADKVTPSVVQFQFTGPNGSGSGSGFVLSQDGYIMTNNHVAEGGGRGGEIQAVFQDGRKAPVHLVGGDPTSDVAVVKADNVSGLRPVELGRSDDLKVGQNVVAIGSPFDLSGTVTSGIVSSVHRPVRAGGSSGDQQTVMDAVQTDAAINPGNSGGPLVNMSGQVIAINSAIYSPQSGSGGRQSSEGGNVGIGFAIPVDQARRTADEIIKDGHATQTYVGATVGDNKDGGALIGDIVPGSPAEKAGLKGGDVVTKLDDRPIDDADALVAAIRTRAPGEKATLTIGGSRTVEVTLDGQPVQPR